MSLSRTGRLIVSCCGVAVVVAAAGVVWMGMESKGGSAEKEREVPGLVPATLSPNDAGGSVPVSSGGPGVGSTGPAGSLPSTGIEAPSVTQSLVLQDGETYFGKGEAFFKDADFASASRYLEAEVQAHPDRFYPAYLLGLSLWKEGRTDEAIASLTSAVTLNKESLRARVNLGRVLNDAGSFEQALAAADEAIAIDADSSQAHNVRGRALLNLKRRDEAIEAFGVAVEKDPGNAYAQNNLGYALIGAERFADALPYLEEAVRLKPEVGYFQNNLGMACERTGRIDRAKAAYREAVRVGGSGSAERNLDRLGGSADEESSTEADQEPSN